MFIQDISNIITFSKEDYDKLIEGKQKDPQAVTTGLTVEQIGELDNKDLSTMTITELTN